LVLSLSLPDLCVEAFALTILEGMSAACPCVVPPVGGHLDYFDEHSGIKVDARDTETIVQFIKQLQQDETLWRGFADRALEVSSDYSAQAYQQRVDDFVCAIQAQYFN